MESKTAGGDAERPVVRTDMTAFLTPGVDGDAVVDASDTAIMVRRADGAAVRMEGEP
jgi:hypothetical protein